jgi:hypothetical protein
VSDKAALGPLQKNRQAIADEEIFEDSEIALDDLPLDRAFPGDLGNVENTALGEAGPLEKAGKSAEVPRQSLLADFLLQIGLYIAGQKLIRFGMRISCGEMAGA